MPNRTVSTPYVAVRHAFINGELVTFSESTEPSPMVEHNKKSMNARRIIASMMTQETNQ